MSSVVLGCDINASNDAEVQNYVAKKLESAGHSVEKLEIAPNPFASYSYSSKAKGKIGVYIIADGIFSIADLTFGNTSFKYGYFIIRGDLGRPRMKSRSDFENNPIGRDPDCTSICDKIAGKSYAQMNEICKSKCQIVFGTTKEEMADELLKAMGGGTSSSKSSSGSSIKNAIKEVLYGWNGDVECYLRDDTIYINKIRDPTSAKLQLVEDVNVFLEGVSIKDIDPNTPNKLIVKWGSNQYIIKDDDRIKRFGEVTKTITSSNKSEKDAIAFAYHEWNKLLKDSGRQLECKIDGGPEWRIGKWVRVYVPTFNLNGYMYLTKVSHDDDTKWKTNVTLTDYPPDLGTKPSKTTNDNNDSTSSDDSNES